MHSRPVHPIRAMSPRGGRGMIVRGIKREESVAPIPLPNIPLPNLRDSVFALALHPKAFGVCVFEGFAVKDSYSVPPFVDPLASAVHISN
jgi:hypothetical protein